MTASGEVHRQQGYPNVSLVVVASNLDAANDALTVVLEHSARGEKWESLASIGESDFDGEVGSIRLSGVALEYLRASITSFDDVSGDDLSVDAYLLLNGNPGAAMAGRFV
ncbi:hypothetical protein [Haloferax volcanii]|uniref:hypothetical protein n=1 Tax=Haloferax volcanii TaxID=2246 RepID=UPI00385D7750